jgi:hypothetical protein
MLLRHSRNGGPLQLWCVELVPKKWKTDQAELREVLWLAGGMPRDEMQALMWMAQVLEGVQDHRERQFARVYQRLVVFGDRKEAQLCQVESSSASFGDRSLKTAAAARPPNKRLRIVSRP